MTYLNFAYNDCSINITEICKGMGQEVYREIKIMFVIFAISTSVGWFLNYLAQKKQSPMKEQLIKYSYWILVAKDIMAIIILISLLYASYPLR